MSCGSSMESDAKKIAEIEIKTMKSPEKISTEENLSNLKLMAEFGEKYSAPADKKKFEEIIEKEVMAAMGETNKK